MVEARRSYSDEIQAWRAGRDTSLRAEDGWLALAGLFWLHEGSNSLGSDLECDITLPLGAAPGHVGALVREGTQVHVQARGKAVTVDGVVVNSATLSPDTTSSPTRFAVGRLQLVVIQRGVRVGLRVWDRENPARREFPGREWFPIQAGYRLEARFIPFDPPKMLPITNILGDTEESPSPGVAEFDLEGQTGRLAASSGDEEGLFFCFRDATSGNSTYPAGRYLVTEPPRGGRLTLDFNRAYNPPCAFTAYATCPLPPPGNELLQAVDAGERYVPWAPHPAG